ncbi:hypothetical protein Bca4012_025947 [Brassica carinata]
MTALDETDTALSEIYEGYYNAKKTDAFEKESFCCRDALKVDQAKDQEVPNHNIDLEFKLRQLQAETRTTQERAKELDPLESGLYACMEEVIRIMDQANVATEKREANLIKDLEGTQRRVGSTKVEESMMLLLVRATSLIYTA